MSSSSVLGQSPCKLSSDLNSPSATQMRRSATEPSSRPSPAHGSNKGRGHGEGNDNKKLRPVDLSKHLLKTKVISMEELGNMEIEFLFVGMQSLSGRTLSLWFQVFLRSLHLGVATTTKS